MPSEIRHHVAHALGICFNILPILCWALALTCRVFVCVGRIEDELCGGGNHDAHPLGLACVCAHDAHFWGADMLVCVRLHVQLREA